MFGIFIIMLTSLGLIYLFLREEFNYLSLYPSQKSLILFTQGFVFFILVSIIACIADTVVFSIEWEYKAGINFRKIVDGFYFHFKSALTEELVFRGAILLVLIKRIGYELGLLYSAFAFGIYHWFTYDLIGNLVPMIYIFLITGAMGYVLAFSFVKTKSIYLGLGLHFGLAVVTSLFSDTPSGDGLWTEVSRVELSEWTNLFYLLIKNLFQAFLAFLLIRRVLISKSFLK